MNRYGTTSYGEKVVAANSEFVETIFVPIFVIGGLLTFALLGAQAVLLPSSKDYTIEFLSQDSNASNITSTNAVQVNTENGIESNKLPDNYGHILHPRGN